MTNIHSASETNQAQINNLLENIANTNLSELILNLLIYTTNYQPTKIIFQDGFSGYLFQEKDLLLSILFAPLQNGNFLINIVTEKNKSVFYQYNEEGEPTRQSNNATNNILFVKMENYHPCPILNHLYSLLNYEYLQAQIGMATSSNIIFCETLLYKIKKNLVLSNQITCSTNDEAYLALQNNFIKNGRDTALTYIERRKKQALLTSQYKLIFTTKKRAHASFQQISTSRFLAHLYALYFKLFFLKYRQNSSGLLLRFTRDPVLWFFRTVKNNIGYSIALAIYGPFTFYFITQPMNPYAMSAVGEVRKTYLNITNSINELLTVLGIAPKEQNSLPQPKPLNNNIAAIKFTPTAYQKVDILQNSTPKTGAMFLSTDFPNIASQAWQSRMSNFKDLQIGYESSLQFSARMGRLEQMETQLNFPLIAESAYRETERYITLLHKTKHMLTTNNTDARFNRVQTYLLNEEQRANQLQLYIWDKLIRYMLDHPYTVMNADKNHKFVDYYTGRSFIFLKEITLALKNKFATFNQPPEFEKIETLAEFYQKKHISGDTIEERLRKNSRLGKQNNFYSSTELRDYLQRQWEILFLLQNKAQEAANFGLQMYVWSVRNAIWVLESTYSTKRQELSLIYDYLLEPTPKNKLDVLEEIKTRVEPLYESLYHILTLEFMSIRTDIDQSLKDDIEGAQRRLVIKNLDTFFEDRESMLSTIFDRNMQILPQNTSADSRVK